ncbi:hypothetical protein KY289_016108 [Solanum tuberosum]|nr:hypothetical protein KY289_016108 [Solanum tuberosum]
MGFNDMCLWVGVNIIDQHICSEAFGTFRFDIHHRYSDPVKGTGLPAPLILLPTVAILPAPLILLHYRSRSPEEETKQSYSVRWDLGPVDVHPLLTCRGCWEEGTCHAATKYVLPSGLTKCVCVSFSLHYANVTVGTPGLSFLVALDTGSDLFWLPCNCNNCAHTLLTGSGRTTDLNIYSPNTSSTSKIVPCNGTLCGQGRQCSVAQSTCAYRVAYLSHNTSSSGVLVKDILHLQTDSSQQKAFEAPITLGCGMKQTGAFLDGAAPNGLFGLGMGNISVPSVLARKGLAANSFSLCFGADGIGRIDFGDKGSLDQGETPFNLEQTHQTYNISLTGITVGNKNIDVDFTAIFDSGTSFTYLNDPAYKVITENFNSQAQELRIQPMVQVPFEYCYGLRVNQTYLQILDVNLMMKGGNQFYLFDPIITLSLPDGSTAYCLAVVKSGDVNIIGQNFMTGYQVVFDREKMVLGWKPSDCYDSKESKSKTILPINKQRPTEGSGPTSGLPEDTRENGNDTIRSTPDFTSSTSAGNYVTKSLTFFCQLVVVLFFL